MSTESVPKPNLETGNPYPGIRPFEEEDAERFFGRDQEIEQLLNLMFSHRFVTVLGVSGSGKSSLVRAGVIPLIKLGMAEKLTGSWRVVTITPGGGPLANLDRVLRKNFPATPASVRHGRQTSFALVEFAQSALSNDESLLVFVDQFEELFPFRRETLASDGGNEAALFVNLLLNAAGQRDVPIYVALAMRSDYLGESAQFRGLPEAMNEGHYLVPRLTRHQQQEAIESPLAELGVTMHPALVQRLLNDSAEEPDHLPVLQHLLKRLWEEHERLKIPTIGFDEYEKVGGWKDAMNRDAEGVFEAFKEPATEDGIRQLFQWITDQGSGTQPVRRPACFSALPEVTNLEPECLSRIIGAFQERGLLRGAGEELRGDTRIDLPHESVAWQWTRLRNWIAEEATDAARLRFFREAAQKQLALTGATLEEARLLRARIVSSPHWAARYLRSPFEIHQTLEWVAESERRQHNEIEALRRGRRRLLYALGAALLVTILVGWLWWRADSSRRESRQQLALNYWQNSRSVQKSGDDLKALHFAGKALTLEPALRDNLLLDLRDVQPSFPLQQMLAHDSNVYGAVFSHDDSRILSWSSDNTARMWDARTGQQIGPALQHQDVVLGAMFSHDESRILTWSSDHTARMWDARTGQQIGPALQHQDVVLGAMFSHDESRILTWSSDHTARVWDARTGQQIGPALQSRDTVYGAVFSHDESRILTWSLDRTARLWDVHTGQQIGHALWHEKVVLGAVFSHDDSRILSWSSDDTARLWNAHTEQQIGPALQHQGAVDRAVFSHDETRILTRSKDHTARLWDAHTGQQICPSLQHQGAVDGAVFSHDESRILTWSEDRTARLWDARTGQQIGPPLWHEKVVLGAVFSHDESRILTWSEDRTARLWDSHTGQQIGPSLQHQTPVHGAVFNHDESHILTWSEDRTARVWDARIRHQIGHSLQHEEGVRGAVFSHDESRILTWSSDHAARLWDAHTGQQIGPPLWHENAVLGAVFSHDESRILTWSSDHTARLWDVSTEQQIGPALRHENVVLAALFSHDESRILTWSSDKTARLWDARTGHQIGPALQHHDTVGGAAFSRDESRILTWSSDQTARLWDARTGQQIGPALQHQGPVDGGVFSRDESRILTWSSDKTARLWDARTGQQIGPALQHGNIVFGAMFSHDESRILTWSLDRTARLWDARTEQQMGPALWHNGTVNGALFSHDESRILTWSSDQTARLWDAPTAQQIGPALQHNDTVYGAVFNHDESRILTWSGDSTARVWFLNADLDFPADSVGLWIEAVTGSELDSVTHEVRALELNRWHQIRLRYETIAAEHAKACKYPEANEWLREQQDPGH